MLNNKTRMTIREHLNSAKHIKIARKCMKRLAELLGCKSNSVKIEGNTSYDDFQRNTASLTMPIISDKLFVWQFANKIIFTGINDRYTLKDLNDAAKELCTAGYKNANDAIAACCITRKSILFDIDEDLDRIFVCSDDCLATTMECRSADEIAEFIYGQMKKDYEKLVELAVKLSKEMKIYELKHEKL